MSIKNNLIEMKKMSELMVDLAYSAVLFNSKDAAEEVLKLENKVNSMNYEIKKEIGKHTSELQSPTNLVCRLLLE